MWRLSSAANVTGPSNSMVSRSLSINDDADDVPLKINKSVGLVYHFHSSQDPISGNQWEREVYGFHLKVPRRPVIPRRELKNELCNLTRRTHNMGMGQNPGT